MYINKSKLKIPYIIKNGPRKLVCYMKKSLALRVYYIIQLLL